MKHTPIHSKCYKFADASQVIIGLEVNDYKGTDENNIHKYIDMNTVQKVFRLFNSLPTYVMYDDITGLVFKDGGPIHNTVKAMLSADLVHLPFNEVVVEFDEYKEVEGLQFGNVVLEGKVKARELVWLGEKVDGFFDNAKDYPFFALPITLIEHKNERPYVILNTNCMVGHYLKDGAEDGSNRLGIKWKTYLAPFIRTDKIPEDMKRKLIDANSQSANRTSSCALTAVVALLKTKGIIQDKIEVPAKMNKSRAATGKPLIKDHTVIRIGHVYDRQGKAIEYNHTGRKMPVHWRAGHIRNQRFGPNRSKSYEIFIEAMLVNYTEGTPLPKTIKEVTI